MIDIPGPVGYKYGHEIKEFATNLVPGELTRDSVSASRAWMNVVVSREPPRIKLDYIGYRVGIIILYVEEMLHIKTLA